MKAGRGVSAIILGTLLLVGCDTPPADGGAAAACGSGALAGDFTPLRQTGDDPAAATAISAAAKVAGTKRAGLLEDYAGYEGRTRSDGARCFRFIPKNCGVGGEVTMCVSSALAVQGITASE